jgi:hypothetical protein
MMSNQKFRFRAFVSLLTGFSFILLTITGIVLYITPPGRVANWTNWTFWGFSKSQWSALHICLSTLFLVVSLLHIWLNFKPLMNYFLNKTKSAFKLRFEWIAAIAVCGFVILGSIKAFMPFGALLDLNEQIKFSWEEPEQQSPVPHAELLTISELAQNTDVGADVIQLNLSNNGIEVELDDVFGDIAIEHNLSPNELFYLAIGNNASSGNQTNGGHGGGRGGAGGGLGQKTLAAACQEMDIDLTKAMEALEKAQIQANPDAKIRAIADENNVHPSQIRQILENL